MVVKQILRKLLPLILRELFPKLKPLEDYVNKPNKNDKAIEKLKKENKETKAHIKRLDNIAHPPFFTAEEKANMEDRIKQLESIDYSIRLRDKENG